MDNKEAGGGDLLVLPSLTSFKMSFDISLYFSNISLSSWRRTPRRCRFWSSWSRYRELQWKWHKCTYSRCSLATCVKTNKKFNVCKSVHRRTIQINHQPDVHFFQFIILTFVYSSTRFGRFPAHHQELNDCSAVSGFTCISCWQSCCVHVRAGRPEHEHSTTVATICR
jgi:hypothetical protein